VLGVLPGVIGSLQATEVLKLILGKGNPLKGQLLIYDALRTNFRKVKIPKNRKCPICGENPTIKELVDYTQEYCAL
jgi:adenylyltransferase/sulfurtransferase